MGKKENKKSFAYKSIRNLSNHLKKRGYTKHFSMRELIGCSSIEFEIYLKSKFKDGMTFSNYGEWHIDHIKPCSHFDLTDPEEQKRCYHYSNLQPLWARENILKGNTYYPEMKSSQSFKSLISQKEKFDLRVLEMYSKQSETEVAKALGVSKQRLYYHTDHLKKQGILIKKGAGTWDVDWEKWNTHSQNIKSSHSSLSQRKKECRGHYWQFKVNIPLIRHWHKRYEYLKQKGIEIKPIHGNMYSIEIDKTKIWLGSSNIILHLSKDAYGVDAEASESLALDKFFNLMRKLEDLMDVLLKQGKGYKFKIPNAHYGLIENSMANIYNKKKDKLYVYDRTGLWCWIDFSDKIDEFETGGKEAKNRNLIMQRQLNEMVETELYPTQILAMIKNLAKMQENTINDFHSKVVEPFRAEVTTHLGLLRQEIITINKSKKERKYRQEGLGRWL